MVALAAAARAVADSVSGRGFLPLPRQMSLLKEMIVGARQDAEKVGVTFIPIVNYPIDWTI